MAIVEGDLARVDRGTTDRHPALDQRAEHGEEPPVRVLDLTAVVALSIDLGIAVEQRGPRDADLVEDDPSVVDAVQPELGATVGERHAGHRLAVEIADRDQQAVHAMRLAADHQLGEHRRHPAVPGRVADVVLARRRGPACG